MIDEPKINFSTNIFVFWFANLPALIWQITNSETRRLFKYFSIGTLFFTLLAPWHRDQLSSEGLTLQGKFQIWALNGVSRFFGAIIKIFTILVGLVTGLGFFIIGLLILVCQIFLPFIIIGLIIYNHGL